MAADGAVDRDSTLLSLERIGDGILRITLEAPEACATAGPGQFAMIEPSPGTFPVTRRPLTISSCDPASGTMSFTFAVAGGGTRLLSELRPGCIVRILAPLGRGYETSAGRWLLVGGGMGTAGFPFLLDRLDSAVVLAGSSTAGRLVCLPPGTSVATEDGSAGRRGLVTGLLEGLDWGGFAGIAACGPAQMLRAVAGMCPEEHRARLQVSMEACMACGWGVCGGCAVPSAGGGYLQCCTDGPVFRADRLDWGRM